MKSDKIKNNLIDKHYNEKNDEELVKATAESEVEAFEKKLNSAGDKMNIVEDMDFDMNIDFINIIEQAERIKTDKKSKKETFYFVFTAIGIFAFLIVLTFSLGTNFLIYFEVIISLLSIVILIFSLKSRLIKEGK